jgi:hypothetical protein
MVPSHESIIERLAAEAIGLGADRVEVEYKNDYEEVFAAKGGLGHGIARFPEFESGGGQAP